MEMSMFSIQEIDAALRTSTSNRLSRKDQILCIDLLSDAGFFAKLVEDKKEVQEARKRIFGTGENRHKLKRR